MLINLINNMRENTKTALVREILLQNPTITANRALAKIVYNKYPLLFKDIEDARAIVRHVIGQNGNQERKEAKVVTTFVERLQNERSKYELDFRTQSDKTPYIFSSQYNKGLIVSDLHYPYTNIDALDLSLEYGYNSGIDCIIINGDGLDFGTIAKFVAKPNEMRVTEQIEGMRNLLKWLTDVTGLKVVYHAGNHDFRLESYLLRQAPELYYQNKLENLLGLKDMGVDYVEEYKHMKFGNLNIAHGHHIVKGIFAPVNPARGVFTKTNTSTLISHVHRTYEHIEVDMNGKEIGCWSIGAMCDIKPDYNPQVSKHQLGFAIVEKEDSGDFEVSNKKIINNKVR